MKCEVCKDKATSICPRCYRYICSGCLDPVTLYCMDCSSFKRWQEEDYLRFVESLEEKIEYTEKAIESVNCKSCTLLKDAVLQNVRRVKELELIAKSEGFGSLHDKLLQVKWRVQNLAVRYLINFKIKRD
jgi:hypothetical protein